MTTNVELNREKVKLSFLKELNDYQIGQVSLAKLTKVQTWAVQGDGIYLLHKNKIGVFVNRKIEHCFPGLESQFNSKNTFSFNLPKIPKVFYNQIQSFFKDVNSKFNVSEAFVQLYYDTTEKKYVAHVPSQRIGPSSVYYDATQNLNNIHPKRYIFVFEIHSHGSMNAFFSGTDNADEKDTRFYGVMGNLDKDEISEKFRYLIGKEEALISKEHLFDLTSEEVINPLKFKELMNKDEKLTLRQLEAFVKSQKETAYPPEWMTSLQKIELAPSSPPASQFHSSVTGDGSIKYHKRDPNWNWKEKREDREAFYEGREGGSRYIGSIPLNLYHESMDAIYNLGEFNNEEVETILDLIVQSFGPIELQILVDKLIEYGHDEVIELVKGEEYGM